MDSKAPITVKALQAIAKQLQIAFTTSTKRADLITLIAVSKGWQDEKPEVIEFLLHGGTIEEVPGFTGIKPKPNARETSAGGKVEPVAPKPARTPRKVSKTTGPKVPGKQAAQKAAGDTVTIQDICAEMGVEGRIARRKLRGSDIAKPDVSWTWPADHTDIQRVRDLLK